MVRNSLIGNNNVAGRPAGVALIAIVIGAFGVVTAFLGLFGMLTGFVTGIMDSSRFADRVFLAGFVGLVLGAIYIIAAIGLWGLRAWAWWLAILVSIVGFVLAFGSPLWMIVWAGLGIYLFLVRANFGTLRIPVVTVA